MKSLKEEKPLWGCPHGTDGEGENSTQEEMHRISWALSVVDYKLLMDRTHVVCPIGISAESRKCVNHDFKNRGFFNCRNFVQFFLQKIIV